VFEDADGALEASSVRLAPVTTPAIGLLPQSTSE
jgi:hypothetical protein